MRNLTVLSGVRMLVAAVVAASGLFASAPQVHGTVQTRGAVLCNKNDITHPNCGNKAGQSNCLATYTKCKGLAGPKDKICSIKSGSDCKADTRCLIQTDYTWSTDCTPTAPSARSNATSSSALRPSQVQ